jgi:single-strand DNA-binding protein
MYLNKVVLYGNLTRDPELKALPSGGQVANFSIATNRIYKDKSGQKQESTEFHNVVAFGRTAELIGQYMKKGKPLYVEGRLQTRSWEKDGQKNYPTEIVVDSFQFGADGKGTTSSRKAEEQSAPADEGIKHPEEEINPEDIPF